MLSVSNLYRHWRAKTLTDAILLRSPRLPDARRVLWHGQQHPAQAARSLAERAVCVLAGKSPECWVLSLGDDDGFHARLNRWLRAKDVRFRALTLEKALHLDAQSCEGLVAILGAYSDARRMTHAARLLAQHPLLAAIAFEYGFGLNPEAEIFNRLDEYRDTFFVSPVQLDEPSPYAIYEESLLHFRQKCGLRDYLDLYQLLKSVVRNEVAGDIAEFGSYEGHSGWLMARTLMALGSNKKLFLFDTFEEFPEEPLGVDQFWNRSHPVKFDEVRAKFDGFENVRLIKGDFTETLLSSGLGAIALAYVDCDSYRATRYLLDTLLSGQLSPRGILACEDYGHPALLGNRAAVHEALDGKQGSFQFYSQFSGFYIVLKF